MCQSTERQFHPLSGSPGPCQLAEFLPDPATSHRHHYRAGNVPQSARYHRPRRLPPYASIQLHQPDTSPPYLANMIKTQYRKPRHVWHHPPPQHRPGQWQNALADFARQHHAQAGHNRVAGMLNREHKMVSAPRMPTRRQMSRHVARQFPHQTPG